MNVTRNIIEYKSFLILSEHNEKETEKALCKRYFWNDVKPKVKS